MQGKAPRCALTMQEQPTYTHINKSQNEVPEKKSKLQESHNDSGELAQPKAVGNKGN